MTEQTEIQIIEGLRQRSPKAQQLTLEQYGSYVWAQVVRLVTGVEDAEEVYQDVFVKVFCNINKYDETRSSFRTWLSRIAYNESISFLRHRRPTVVYFEERDVELEAITDAEVEDTLGRPNAEVVQLIRAAIQYLPPDEQAIITMFYYEEMSLKEIAFVTESIPTTIASKLSRTRKKLCKIIQTLRS